MVNVTRKLAVLGGISVVTALTDGGHFETVPTYPTPESIGTGWEAAFQKATDAVAKLNVTQKVALTTGAAMGLSCNGNINPIEEIGFSGYCLADGPVSVRIADLATVFPAGLTAAATWDRDLIYQRGKALGAEFRGKGAQVHLGSKESDYDFPIVNITGDAARDSAAWQADFTEGQFIDYRHLDAKNITPQYEFGFGLSYTTFEMGSKATFERKCAGISPLPPRTSGTHPGGNPAL
ncbi:hypothetical protein BN1723_013218 [Verticillium longisporum]|uniref:beta-glucosidase n=1 Tax=Verticillium longisporum TaxID=100787 RepID=A0A0G4LQJ0_VERLO|nr:hypothetical protein BN1723_013218 [Verticillium longisporum]